MQYRRLGNAGIKLSAVGLGGWTTFGESIQDPALAREIIVAAYDAGINFFDIADAYARGEAERMMGHVLREFPRHTLVISSKLYWPMSDNVNDRGLSRKHIMESVDKSLQRIGTDYLDIYYCHRFDEETPLEETIRAMDDLVHQGKVLYWGTSEWDAFHLSQAIGCAHANGLIPPVVEQSRYNLMQRRRVEQDLAALVQEYGLGLTTFSPLYYGILSGKYNQGIPAGSRATLEDMAWVKDRITPQVINQVQALTDVAAGLGATTAQLAIAWILRRKEVSSVITGATRLEQLDENLSAADAVPLLTDEVLERIEQIMGNIPEE